MRFIIDVGSQMFAVGCEGRVHGVVDQDHENEAHRTSDGEVENVLTCNVPSKQIQLLVATKQVRDQRVLADLEQTVAKTKTWEESEDPHQHLIRLFRLVDHGEDGGQVDQEQPSDEICHEADHLRRGVLGEEEGEEVRKRNDRDAIKNKGDSHGPQRAVHHEGLHVIGPDDEQRQPRWHAIHAKIPNEIRDPVRCDADTRNKLLVFRIVMSLSLPNNVRHESGWNERERLMTP